MTVNGTVRQMMLSVLHALFWGLLKMCRNASDMSKKQMSEGFFKALFLFYYFG